MIESKMGRFCKFQKMEQTKINMVKYLLSLTCKIIMHF